LKSASRHQDFSNAPAFELFTSNKAPLDQKSFRDENHQIAAFFAETCISMHLHFANAEQQTTNFNKIKGQRATFVLSVQRLHGAERATFRSAQIVRFGKSYFPLQFSKSGAEPT